MKLTLSHTVFPNQVHAMAWVSNTQTNRTDLQGGPVLMISSARQMYYYALPPPD